MNWRSSVSISKSRSASHWSCRPSHAVCANEDADYRDPQVAFCNVDVQDRAAYAARGVGTLT
jgi:hypothetical protein